MQPTKFRRGSIALAAAAMLSVFITSGSAVAGPAENGVLLAPFSEGGRFDAAPPATPAEAGELPAAVSMAVTPEGNIIYWDGLSGLADSNVALPLDAGRTGRTPDRSMLLVLDDAAQSGWQLGTPLWLATEPTGNGGSNDNLFCADQRLLTTGAVLVAGGTDYETEAYADIPVDDPATHEPPGNNGGVPDGLAELYGSKHTRLYTDDGESGGSWSWDGDLETGDAPSNMDKGRWYPTLITLADGTPLVAGGVSKLLWNSNTLPGDAGARATGPAPVNVPEMELYDRETNTWSTLPESANKDLPLFARFHLLTNGQVFYGGVGQMWGPAGESINELGWGNPSVFDPTTNTWTDLAADPLSFLFDAKSGAFSVPLMFEPGEDGEYNTTKILVGGGILGVSPGTLLAQAETEILTLTEGEDGTVAFDRTQVGDLNNDRWYSSSVLLPNGQVLAINGADKDEVHVPGLESAIQDIELFDPESGEWTVINRTARQRTYHNSAMLLPDGSVLIGGHSPINLLYGGKGDNSGNALGGANNFRDPSFEIFQPPYLFNEDGTPKARPVIAAESANVNDENVLKFVMGAGNTIDPTSVTLTRLPSTTHITDADMRGVVLPGTPEFNGQTNGADQYKISIPDDPNVLPPGYYYAWISGDTGAPSVAQIIEIG